MIMSSFLQQFWDLTPHNKKTPLVGGAFPMIDFVIIQLKRQITIFNQYIRYTPEIH